MAGVTEALTTGFGTVATSALSVIGDVLPIAIPIVGAFVVVKVGYRAFKAFTK